MRKKQQSWSEKKAKRQQKQIEWDMKSQLSKEQLDIANTKKIQTANANNRKHFEKELTKEQVHWTDPNRYLVLHNTRYNIYAHKFPQYLFQEIAHMSHALSILDKVVVSDIVTHIRHTYTQILKNYNYDYSDLYFTSTITKYEKSGYGYSTQYKKFEIPECPLQYVHNIVRHIHNHIVDKLQKGDKKSIVGGMKYTLPNDAYLKCNKIVWFRVSEITVHDYQMKVYNCNAHEPIDSIAKYISLCREI